MLPFALVGTGAVVAALRRSDPRLGSLRPRFVEGPLVLVGWFAVPFVLAILYNSGWPFEDALRPQRLWLLSSQPAAILAAGGLVVAVDRIVAIRLRRPELVARVLVLAVVLAPFRQRSSPCGLLAGTWTEPEYAHLRLVRDRVPAMASILGTSGPRETVLTYEDWSSLAWYQTGAWVVAVNPPGYAKLAFDPDVFTGDFRQEQRRADVARAFNGAPIALALAADQYGADRILLARRGETWGTIHQVAATTARNDRRDRRDDSDRRRQRLGRRRAEPRVKAGVRDRAAGGDRPRAAVPWRRGRPAGARSGVQAPRRGTGGRRADPGRVPAARDRRRGVGRSPARRRTCGSANGWRSRRSTTWRSSRSSGSSPRLRCRAGTSPQRPRMPCSSSGTGESPPPP